MQRIQIDHHAEAMLRLPCVKSVVKVGKGTGDDDYDIAYIVETEGKMKFAYRGDMLMEEYGEWYLSPQGTCGEMKNEE